MHYPVTKIILLSFITSQTPFILQERGDIPKVSRARVEGSQSYSCPATRGRTDSITPDSVPLGSWGGEHIGLQVTEKGGIFELDCANGTIEESLALDARARFDSKGVYVREHAGPAHEGQRSEVHPAHFSGWSDGKRMTLIIKLTDTGQTIGEFKLTIGQEPQITKCL